jgi:hypothetical protein
MAENSVNDVTTVDETTYSCSSSFYHNQTVCVPVTVTPYAVPGTATARCCGLPTVTSGNTCTGGDKSCVFTVSQSLCIQVPISFGADVNTGETAVECGGSSLSECNCSGETSDEITNDTTTDSGVVDSGAIDIETTDSTSKDTTTVL